MEIFISYSGETSIDVAETLYDWIPNVIPDAKLWMAKRDIPPGSRWRQTIESQLKDNCFGLIFLASDNLTSPWIYYEAGALSKGRDDARIWTILIDIKETEVRGPLEQFQHTILEKEGIRKLIYTINSTSVDQCESDLDSKFNIWWPILEEKLCKFIDQDKHSEDIIDETVVKSIHGFFEIYREVFWPVYIDAVTHLEERPDFICLEQENILAHISQAFNPNLNRIQKEENILKAERHLRRAILDCRKIVISDILTNLNKFKIRKVLDNNFKVEVQKFGKMVQESIDEKSDLDILIKNYKSIIEYGYWLLGKYE